MYLRVAINSKSNFNELMKTIVINKALAFFKNVKFCKYKVAVKQKDVFSFNASLPVWVI